MVAHEQISDQWTAGTGSQIRGIEGLTSEQLEKELAAGGRFVFFEYCISLLVLTLRRPSAIYFLKGDQSGLVHGLRYSVLSLLLGWWGVPWGIFYTLLTLLNNLSGGCDITAEVRAMLHLPSPGSSPEDV
jgi:hypothetical protein